MSNSIEMTLVLFGAGKAGVSVVPINTSVTDAAVAGMIDDSGAAGVVASGEHCARIDALVARAGDRGAARPARCRAAAGPRLDGSRGLAVEASAGALRGGRHAGHRVQHHLQLGHDRPAEGHRAHARLPHALGRGSRASRCATTAARSPCVRSGCTPTSAGSRCCARPSSGGTLVVMPSFSAGVARRDDRAAPGHARRVRAGAVPAAPGTAGLARVRHWLPCSRSCVAARRCRSR